MLTSTERLGRTRLRVSPGTGTGRCRVRTATTQSDATASVVRPVLVAHDRERARVSLVPEGALLLAGDAVEIDVTVDAGMSLDLVEPGGTVAFDMRGGTARWDVRVELGAGARLTWGGLPFVVSEGADVTRSLRVRCGSGAHLRLREVLVLGRFGERPGRLRQTSTVLDGDGRPVLVEDLPLNPSSTALLLGGHRVLSSVLALGTGLPDGDDPDRYDLAAAGAVLWRRLGHHAHEAELAAVWRQLTGER